jgi:excisionase family DNA binding protein
MPPKYVTTSEAAERLNYTIQHVRRLVREGKIRGEKYGRDWLLTRDDVERHAVKEANLSLPLESVRGDGEGRT